MSVPDLVKEYFQKKQKRRIPSKYTSQANVDPTGFHENCTGITHPNVIASHDSIWHFTQIPKHLVKPAGSK